MKDAPELASQIMIEFARVTGLASDLGADRYLWTDAFAVCNFLGLCRHTGDEEYKRLALRLVDQVHSTLGRYGPEDMRTGWISGLQEEEAILHPTARGLRIGKKMRERRRNEPPNDRLEWDRDGQYFHYLTQWMHALDCVARETGVVSYNKWANELARAAYAGFVSKPSPTGLKRMYWKMSIDLSYPLVPSMGLHDPLDGLITYAQLQEHAEDSMEMRDETAGLLEKCEGRDWATDDTLGIGMLLSGAFRVAQLSTNLFSVPDLLATLLDASLRSLRTSDNSLLEIEADYRLPFRELGLAIGFHAIKQFPGLIDRRRSFFGNRTGLDRLISALTPYCPLGAAIEAYWLAPEHRGETWTDHRNINMVMLATSLMPDGYLTLPERPVRGPRVSRWA